MNQPLRDPASMQWYAIPLLAIVFYVYAFEISTARRRGDWNIVLAGLTVFGMDFVNESLNGWILALTGRGALWTVPGPSALRTMVGWNLEIMFMFALAGLVYARSVTAARGSRWLWAVAYSAFSVVVELWLQRGGLLVWEYRFWNGTLAGVWLIFLLGYLHFYVAAGLVIGARRMRTKLIAVGAIYGVAVILNVIGLGILGWTY